MIDGSGSRCCRDRDQTENGAVTSAVLVHLRVESAHFDWRWRERPALALLAWEAMARDPMAKLRRIQVESIGTKINFRPAPISPIARVVLPPRIVSLFLTGRDCSARALRQGLRFRCGCRAPEL
jgi:hypothetical protein